MNAILHIVNKSPFSSQALDACLNRMKNDDAIILLEDGVYAALTTQPHSMALNKFSQCYAIQKDIEARGLASDALLSNIQLIDFDTFVDLTVEYPLNHSWY